MKIFNLVVPLLGLVGLSSASLAPAERQVLVTYPASTPASIVQEAKEAIVAAVGTALPDCISECADMTVSGWKDY